MTVRFGLHFLRTRVAGALILLLLFLLFLGRRRRVGLLLDVLPLAVSLEGFLYGGKQLDESFCDGRLEHLWCEL